MKNYIYNFLKRLFKFRKKRILLNADGTYDELKYGPLPSGFTKETDEDLLVGFAPISTKPRKPRTHVTPIMHKQIVGILKKYHGESMLKISRRVNTRLKTEMSPMVVRRIAIEEGLKK